MMMMMMILLRTQHYLSLIFPSYTDGEANSLLVTSVRSLLGICILFIHCKYRREDGQMKNSFSGFCLH